MSRHLIDKEKVIKTLEFLAKHEDSFRRTVIYGVIHTIKTIPTIDAVELPCKIGDKVWIARQYKCHKRPRCGIVSEMFFTDNMELCIVVKGVARGKWGVDVFATYEEAQAEIERRGK